MKTTIIFPDKLIQNQINTTKVAMLAAIAVVSLMLFISISMIDFTDHSTLSSMMICAGVVGVVASGIISMSLKHEVVAETHSPLVCRTIEFKESVSEDVIMAASDNRWSDVRAISKVGYGGAMRLEFVYSKDRRFAAYQIFKYVPHSYEPCSEICYINKDYISHIGRF